MIFEEPDNNAEDGSVVALTFSVIGKVWNELVDDIFLPLAVTTKYV